MKLFGIIIETKNRIWKEIRIEFTAGCRSEMIMQSLQVEVSMLMKAIVKATTAAMIISEKEILLVISPL